MVRAMIVRAAGEADLGSILEITNEAITNTTAIWTLTPATLETRRTWMHERQSRGFPVFVAAADDDDGEGAVRGFASYGPYRPWEGYLHTVELSLYVHPSAQGRGLGRRLLAALVEHATGSGKHVMVACIEAANNPSIALHRRAGFVEAGCLRQVGRKFDRWLDLLIMQKVLAGPDDPPHPAHSGVARG